ncbi:arca-like protein [Diplodia corticola]|uniref:Arca-like protein n=1 Tax=Diplodia corticola TaxID=236234 RepID=A0A1J9RU56_9PEZI|nr:arca-like protein [Diplodia corticola]OJD31959.1 arca-like protein [Diplodia corticola]
MSLRANLPEALKRDIKADFAYSHHTCGFILSDLSKIPKLRPHVFGSPNSHWLSELSCKASEMSVTNSDPHALGVQRVALNVVANVKGSGIGKCDYDFSKTQPWCKITHSLNYVDETPELRNIYDHDQDADDNRVVTPPGWRDHATLDSTDDTAVRSLSQSVAVRPCPETRQRVSEAGSSPKRCRLETPHRAEPSHKSPGQESSFFNRTATRLRSESSQVAPSDIASLHLSPRDGFAPLEPASSLASNFATEFPSISSNATALSHLYLDTPIWPLEKKEEAVLLRYFVDNLASSFDLCDPDRHFQLVVPHRAAVCPPLMNAILAVAARHWSRVGEYDPYVAERYHSECLKHLIPMLDETAALMDENLLAATVMLRFLEEIDIPVSGDESQSHLLGTQVFLTAQERSTVYGGLRQAAFWVGLRQEIYMAFVNQRTIIPALEHCSIDRTFDTASDCVWANRIVTHCADVLRYCFGDGEQTVANYNRLLDYCDGWFMFKPPSFSPIFYRVPDGVKVIFPEIWLLSDAVTTGLQHYHLAKILLTAHNPRVPRLGPGQKLALTRIDEQIKEDVRALCGMANSNSGCPPNYVTASMAIALAGERFTDAAEQKALMEVLGVCERMHAWPTRVA